VNNCDGSIAYNPLRVCALSKTPYVPSRIAFTTLVVFARIGQGLSTIKSITQVITVGLFAKLHSMSTNFSKNIK
jgi:hypothetical protein